MKALSFLQPWGWLVANGLKPIENRKRYTTLRDQFLVHISQRTTQKYYDGARSWLVDHGLGDVVVPPLNELPHGGFIGSARICSVLDPEWEDMFTTRADPRLSWWMRDQYGYVLDSAKRCKFVEWPGALGFWNVPDRIVKRCGIL
jgi:hypothetical protein